MKVNLFFDVGFENDKEIKKRIRSFVIKTSKLIFSDENTNCNELNIKFVDDKEILKFNKYYLSHNYNTDVITFKYEDNDFESDIIISMETIERNAKRYKCSFNSELSRVIIHGLLHLAGYDDVKISDRRLMKKKEDYYLTKNIL